MEKQSRIGVRVVFVRYAAVAPLLAAMVLAGFGCGSGPALAQAGPVMNAGQGESPFVRVADAVIPTVVYISAERTIRTGLSSPGHDGQFDEFFRRLFPEMPGFPLEQHQQALGSGVIIDPRGYIVTNNHVVAGFEKIAVKLSDGTEFGGGKVKVVGRDPKTDLAVLKVEAGHSLPAISFGRSDSIKVGDWAIAVGNAFGLQSTVTVGVISAKGRTGLPLTEGPSYQDFIQTDASINPGNSGGPLVNIHAEIIGINTAIRSPTGASAGVGFAVPVEMVRSVTSQLIERGKVVRGFLGIRPQPVTEAIRRAKGLANTRGVLVSEVVEDKPADKAGIRDGDVILKVNGTELQDMEQFRRLIAEFAPGTDVTLELVRDRKALTRRVVLAEMPDDQQAAAPEEDKPVPKLGLEVRALTSAERREADAEGGVIVESVQSGSAAAEAGLQRGDIVLEVGERDIEGLDDYRQALDGVGPGEAVLFRILRSGTKLYIAVEAGE